MYGLLVMVVISTTHVQQMVTSQASTLSEWELPSPMGR